MAKYEWSEIFLSIEGEGPYSGHPTVYIRFSRCNFTCAKFNNPDNIVDADGYAVLSFDPKTHKSLDELSPIEIGCDSQYAVNPTFKHMWHKGNENQLADEVMQHVPHNAWTNPLSGQRSILSLTGGEPTLRWKTIPTLLNLPQFDDLQTVLIETNCAVPFKEEFIDELGNWVEAGMENNLRRKIVWSNSPKLSVSGEPWNKAIVPEIARQQREVVRKHVLLRDDQVHQYFKFVCGPTEKDFDEVATAMAEYHEAGIPKEVEVYIMPQSCTIQQQQEIASDVALMCIDRGYIYCHRIHLDTFGNAIGT